MVTIHGTLGYGPSTLPLRAVHRVVLSLPKLSAATLFVWTREEHPSKDSSPVLSRRSFVPTRRRSHLEGRPDRAGPSLVYQIASTTSIRSLCRSSKPTLVVELGSILSLVSRALVVEPQDGTAQDIMDLWTNALEGSAKQFHREWFCNGLLLGWNRHSALGPLQINKHPIT